MPSDFKLPAKVQHWTVDVHVDQKMDPPSETPDTFAFKQHFMVSVNTANQPTDIYRTSTLKWDDIKNCSKELIPALSKGRQVLRNGFAGDPNIRQVSISTDVAILEVRV